MEYECLFDQGYNWCAPNITYVTFFTDDMDPEGYILLCHRLRLWLILFLFTRNMLITFTVWYVFFSLYQDAKYSKLQQNLRKTLRVFLEDGRVFVGRLQVWGLLKLEL